MQLDIRNISNTYRNGVQALRNVSLTISPGMYGLLGPNGAGTTLMRTIATFQQPDSGTITLGVLRQKDEVKKTLGYLPQEFGVYPNVTAERLLDHFAVLEGITDKRARPINEIRYGLATHYHLDHAATRWTLLQQF